jgi:hypothetical protein
MQGSAAGRGVPARSAGAQRAVSCCLCIQTIHFFGAIWPYYGRLEEPLHGVALAQECRR